MLAELLKKTKRYPPSVEDATEVSKNAPELFLPFQVIDLPQDIFQTSSTSSTARRLRLVMISDTHNMLRKVDIPAGDILLHAGDFTNDGSEEEIDEFLDAFHCLPHRHKLLVDGNHDWWLRDKIAAKCRALPDVHFLQDASLYVEGLLIHGRVWRSNLKRPPIPTYPLSPDILLSHEPPFGVLDRVGEKQAEGDHDEGGVSIGCEDLLAEVVRVAPRMHLFGHVHSGVGTQFLASQSGGAGSPSPLGVWCVNAAVCIGFHSTSQRRGALVFDCFVPGRDKRLLAQITVALGTPLP